MSRISSLTSTAPPMPLKPTKIVWGEEFVRAYATKGERERKSIDRALRMLAEDVYYPSLRVHKLEGHGDIRGAHASDNQVMTLTVDGSIVQLRTCCNRDDVYRSP